MRNQEITSYRVGLLAGAVMTACVSPHARCEETLEPLVVTAEADTDDTTEDIGMLSELASGKDLRDLLRMLPNVHTGEAPGTLFSLRGVALEGVLVPGNRTNPALAVMSGQIPRTTNSMWVLGMPAWDLAGFAVKSGPQLFHDGPSAAGGLIQLTPNQPVFEEHGRFLAEAGEYGKYQSGITINSVMAPDKLALRLNLLADGGDGGLTNIADDDDRFASSDRLMARAQLRWQPAGDELTRLDLLVEGTRMRGNPLGFAGMRPDFDLFDRKVDLNQHERAQGDHLGVSAHLQSEITPSRKLETWITLQNADGFQLVDLDNSPSANWWYRADVDEKRLTGGTDLHFQGDHMNATLGVYADAGDYKLDYYGRGLSATVDGDPFSTGIDESVDMAAMFARGEFEFNPDWWVFGGLRIDGQQRKVDLKARMGDDGSNHARERVQSLTPLPEAGIEWRGPAATAGMRISRYFQPEGISYAFTLGNATPYDATDGWEIEGYGEWKTDTLRICPRVFFARVTDTQVALTYPGGYPALDPWIVNAGDSVRYGAELQLGWQGPGALYLGAHGGWLTTDLDGFDLHGVSRESGSLPNAPEWNAGLVFSWKPPTGWFAQSTLTWQDETYSQFSSPAATRIEDRLELTARIGYRWGRAEIYGFGHNLLDRDFALVRRDFTGTGTAVQGAPNTPRTLGIGFAIDW